MNTTPQADCSHMKWITKGAGREQTCAANILYYYYTMHHTVILYDIMLNYIILYYTTDDYTVVFSVLQEKMRVLPVPSHTNLGP